MTLPHRARALGPRFAIRGVPSNPTRLGLRRKGRLLFGYGACGWPLAITP